MAGECRKEVLRLARSQIGYAEQPLGSNHNKYAQYFDTPKSKNGPYPWFNGKKQNVAWCAIWICWIFVMVLEKILGSADKVRQWLKFPKPSENCAAGVPFLWQYLCDLGWRIDKSKGEPGDIIFFNTSSARCGHVGLINEVDAKYKTIEGNKSNRVGEGSYGKNSSNIYGVIHVPWEQFDYYFQEQQKDEQASEPVEDHPEPLQPVEPATPEAPAKPVAEQPKPVATPKTTTYKIKTITGLPLRLRTQPNTNCSVITTIKNGTKVEVIKTQGGWAKAKYNGKEGWLALDRLVKV